MSFSHIFKPGNILVWAGPFIINDCLRALLLCVYWICLYRVNLSASYFSKTTNNYEIFQGFLKADDLSLAEIGVQVQGQYCIHEGDV